MYGRVVSTVLSQPTYILITGITFFVSLTVVLLLPNLELLLQVFSDAEIHLADKLLLALTLYGSLATNFTLISALYTVVLLVLFSLYVPLLFFYIKKARRISRGGLQIKSVAAFVSGVLGIGCAACGSVILSSVVAGLGAAGILTFLPLHGGEFALISIVILLFVIHYLVKKINDPLVCKS